jgi:hypothetical protein
MADAMAKAERSKAKDARQGIAPQKEHWHGKKKKIEKPYKVCTMSTMFDRNEKWVRYDCFDLKHAQKMLEKANRESNREHWIELDGEKI